MSFSYDRYERQSRRGAGPSRRTAYGYWIPLGLTVLAATVGLVAWAWKERQDTPGDDEQPGDTARRGQTSKRSTSDRPPSYQSELQQEETSFGMEEACESIEVVDEESESFMSKVGNTVRGALTPQQMYDGASRQVAAGVAAAGAVIGRGLGGAKEDNDDYRDHRTWSEEAETRDSESPSKPVPSAPSTGTSKRRAIGKQKRKMVAVVVSAEIKEDHGFDAEEQLYHISHASVLAHLNSELVPQNIQLIVLIYAPHLRIHPLTAASASRAAMHRSSSTGSSYSNISAPLAQDEEDELSPSGKNDIPYNPLYEGINSQAQELVDHPTQVLPFTTSTGHIHLLRHLSPSTVYLQEALGGDFGENVEQIKGWVGQIVLLVGGVDTGGGSVDAETESEDAGKEAGKELAQKWWMDEARVGLGKGVEVVESKRLGEDWARRVTR